VAKDVNVAVIRPHAEVGVLRAVPLVEHLFHLVEALAEIETERTLVGLVAGVTLDPQAHARFHSTIVIRRCYADLSRSAIQTVGMERSKNRVQTAISKGGKWCQSPVFALPSPSFFDRTNAGMAIRVQATNFATAAKFAPVPELREPGRRRV
jgi:hypothetical protein